MWNSAIDLEVLKSLLLALQSSVDFTTVSKTYIMYMYIIDYYYNVIYFLINEQKNPRESWLIL